MQVYADNAATAKISEHALSEMIKYYSDEYQNPSSLHAFGQAAADALTDARERIASVVILRASSLPQAEARQTIRPSSPRQSLVQERIRSTSYPQLSSTTQFSILLMLSKSRDMRSLFFPFQRKVL